jgi:predicted nucleic acid-binding protein
MLLDSNIIIYAAQPEHAALRRFIAENEVAVSADILPTTQSVLDRAIQLRQTRKMSLGDALVAATALVFGQTLVSRNVKGFTWIGGLNPHNPMPD